ncbi:MAG: hypothetical protein ACRCYT_02025 [Cetobacterium sp.]
MKVGIILGFEKATSQTTGEEYHTVNFMCDGLEAGSAFISTANYNKYSTATDVVVLVQPYAKGDKYNKWNSTTRTSVPAERDRDGYIISSFTTWKALEDASANMARLKKLKF